MQCALAAIGGLALTLHNIIDRARSKEVASASVLAGEGARDVDVYGRMEEGWYVFYICRISYKGISSTLNSECRLALKNDPSRIESRHA